MFRPIEDSRRSLWKGLDEMHWMQTITLLFKGSLLPGRLTKQCQRKDWKTHHAKECKYLQLNPTTDPPPSLIRGVMRLINLYSGDEKNLGFAEDVAKLQSHIEKEEKMKRWEEIEELSQGINRITTKIGGKPLSEDGVRGIQQLCCKVTPFGKFTDKVSCQLYDARYFIFR